MVTITKFNALTIGAAVKRNGTSENYGFNMVGRTREHGNATMQVGFIYGYDGFNFKLNSTRFNIDGSGNLTASDTSIGSLSDERLKKNIKDHTYSLDTFKKFDVKTFDWKNPEEHGNRSNQKLIAQEVEKIDPSLVYEYEVKMVQKIENISQQRKSQVTVLMISLRKSQSLKFVM